MVLSFVLAVAAIAQQPAWSQPPISYGETASRDAVARLDAALGAGKISLRPDGEPLRIEAILDALDVPRESQMTVFSSASLQARRITPERPRAVYFSDDVYIGYVPGGRFVELIATDEHEGLVFYTLNRRDEEPRFQRETHRCLQCHAASHTGGMPAHLMRSLTPKANGDPDFAAGSTYVDPSTPFGKRWGGWYVTGSVGELAHLGNKRLGEGEKELVPTARRYRSLAGLCDTAHYPVDTSDVVAFLVLEHQTHVQNALVLASYEARRALEYQRALNEALGEAPDAPVSSTTTRLDTATQRIVDALVGVNEVALPGPVGQRSPFVEVFESRGIWDDQGRSLRQFDLESRLFRYPLSYAIHSTAMKTLPPTLQERVWKRLGELFCRPLEGDDLAAYGAVICAEKQQAVRAIVKSTFEASAANSAAAVSALRLFLGAQAASETR